MSSSKYKFLGIVILLITGVLSYYFVKDNKVTEEEKQFVFEYEKLNSKKSITTGKKYMEINIPEKNNIKYLSSKTSVKFLEEGTGVIYFGFPECPWCRNVVVPLIEVMNEEEVDVINYYNAYSIRDEKKNVDGEIITTVEGTKDYYKILDLLGDKADNYEGLDDDNIKRLYFPTVVFVKDGKVVFTHTSTVDSQKDPYKKLNEKQVKELKKIYKKGIKMIRNNSQGEICSGKESC